VTVASLRYAAETCTLLSLEAEDLDLQNSWSHLIKVAYLVSMSFIPLAFHNATGQVSFSPKSSHSDSDRLWKASLG
jgi:hypothetical protein